MQIFDVPVPEFVYYELKCLKLHYFHFLFPEIVSLLHISLRLKQQVLAKHPYF